MNMKRVKKIMNFDLYTKLISEIAKKNPTVRVWEIFFGDPFCCPDITERVFHAKVSGLTDVVLNSNGLAMSPAMSKKLILAGLDAMYVGIDAVTEETYNKIRIGGNFSRVVSNILAYKNLLADLGDGNQKLFVQFVVSEQNEHEVAHFTEFWKKNGVNVKIRPRISWSGLIPASNLKENLERRSCNWLSNSMAICNDGIACLCAVDIHCKVPVGDCNKESIEDIWNGKLREYRICQENKEFHKLPTHCRDCLDWQSDYCTYDLAEVTN
jgi:MoaA/NifB/PqqE/SkfB family radical SAM enzyme